MGVDPSSLRPNTQVRFPGRTGVYTILTVEPGPFWEFVVRPEHGPPRDVTLSEEEVGWIELVGDSSGPTFEGDPRQFRLGVEALRIQNAFHYDMAALAVSQITPYPHQLDAVYEHFVPQPRLRFLLGDDPGAGKTIMAGLYIKELMLRRAAERILIVCPANLRLQWHRELAERFHLDCAQMERAVFNAYPTQNPWDVHDLVVVSRDFLAIPSVREAFTAAERDWDLAIVDEAHGFTLQVDGKGAIKKRTERYKAAEQVAARADRLILLTATPHSGKTESVWGLLRLLDPDAYGDRCPRMPGELELSPNNYRKVSKEQMRDMRGVKLFKPRHARTIEFDLLGAELDLYNAVTGFVSKELAEIHGDGASNAAGFALTTMQRRLASSVRAIRRTIQRRIDRLERALNDPEAYLRRRKDFRESLPEEDPDEQDEEARWRVEDDLLDQLLPETVQGLNNELAALEPLLQQACATEDAGGDVKFTKLAEVIDELGLSEDRGKKLLIFTEHKDTLRYLVDRLKGDFEMAVIHGGMDLRERIAAEKHFREDAQIMVATEAAGEGINLQFCHLLVNYDIPWNPNRLEQRMGRIHRIGQDRDVYVFNLVARNTREGYVLAALLRKVQRMGDELGEKAFDVIGEVFADYRMRELLQRVVAKEISREAAAAAVGGDEIDPVIRERYDAIMDEALATDHLDWQQASNRAAEAKERRLPPGYLARFFRDAIDFLGGRTQDRLDRDTFRVTRTPAHLVARSREATQTREIFPHYDRLTFDRSVATRPSTGSETRTLPEPELCGPGHPLFDVLVEDVIDCCWRDVEVGAIFSSPDIERPTAAYFLTGDCIDAADETVHRSFSVVLAPEHGALTGSGIFLYDLLLRGETERPQLDLPEPGSVVNWARKHEFEARYKDVRDEQKRIADIQASYLTRSFAAIVARHDAELLELDTQVDQGSAGAEGRVRRAELAKAQVIERRDRRLREVEAGRSIQRGPVRILAAALLVPGERDPEERSDTQRLSGQQIERIAIDVASRYEQEVRQVDFFKSVEAENIGFDLLSVKGIDRRCIEVKGRAGVATVELTWSEFMKAVGLGEDYWLYVVLDCAKATPRLYRVRDPARTLGPSWETDLEIRYRVQPRPVIDAAETDPTEPGTDEGDDEGAGRDG